MQHHCVSYCPVLLDYLIKLFWRHGIDWRTIGTLRSIPAFDHRAQFPQRQLINGSWCPFEEGTDAIDA